MEFGRLASCVRTAFTEKAKLAEQTHVMINDSIKSSLSQVVQSLKRGYDRK